MFASAVEYGRHFPRSCASVPWTCRCQGQRALLQLDNSALCVLILRWLPNGQWKFRVSSTWIYIIAVSSLWHIIVRRFAWRQRTLAMTGPLHYWPFHFRFTVLLEALLKVWQMSLSNTCNQLGVIMLILFNLEAEVSFPVWMIMKLLRASAV